MVHFSENTLSSVYRIFALIVIGVAIFLMCEVALTNVPYIFPQQSIDAVEGKIEINEPIDVSDFYFLNGAWAYYPYNILEKQEDNTKQEYRNFPLGIISDSSEYISYKLNIKLEDISHSLVLLIPHSLTIMKVILNDTELKPIGSSTAFMESLFPIYSLDSNREWQELTIIVENSEGFTPLYKKDIILGTYESINKYNYLINSNSLLILGILLLILLGSFMFMFLQPGHKILSLISLFDLCLIIRICFGLPEILYFTQTFWPYFNLSSSAMLSFQIIALMVGGATGCLLSHQIFDEHNKVPIYLTLPFPITYLIFACFFPFNLHFFETTGLWLILGVYSLTFIVVSLQYKVFLSEKRSVYDIFQVFKTSYIGIIIFIDILFFDTKINFIFLTYLYIIYFLSHQFIRLYDSNLSYKNVEFLNQNLEKTIAERTAELTETNHILSELSQRDPLTRAYNRLYFEQVIEKAIQGYGSIYTSLHLCVFDLDFFKTINDTYGHAEGDEQLKELVQLVNGLLHKSTFLARVGGEEFVLFFMNKSDEFVFSFVEMIRLELEKSAKNNKKRTTASFGIAIYDKSLSQKDFFKVADKRLYLAKNSGRNMVCTSDEV